MAIPRRMRKKMDEDTTDSKIATRKPVVKRGEARKDGALDTKVPTTKDRGNAKADEVFVTAMQTNGLIEEIGEDEQDIPFGARLRFTGNKDDIGSYWQVPDEERRCHGWSKVRDREGRPVVDENNEYLFRQCLRARILGATVCVKHGGGTENVRNAAKMRLLGAADSLIGQLIAIAMDPKQDGRSRVMAINSALDRAGINGKIEISVEVPVYKKLAQSFEPGWDNGKEADDGE